MGLKWGVLGAGSVAQRRTMPAINLADNAELYSLFSRDKAKAQRLADEHGATCYFTDVDALIQDEQLDVLYVSSPVYLHCEHVIKGAEAGKHILCEKPMAMNVEECQRMIDACATNDVQLQLCFLFRFHSCFQKLRKWIQDGRFGRVLELRMPFLKSIDVNGTWRSRRDEGGGGALMDLGAHAVDLIRYLAGEIRTVTGMFSTLLNDYEVDETASVLMRLENGAHAYTDVSFAIRGTDIVLEVYGSEGWVIVYNDHGWKLRVHEKENVFDEASGFENLYQFQIEHFGRCIVDGESPVVTGDDGLQNIKVLTAAYHSWNTHTIVTI